MKRGLLSIALALFLRLAAVAQEKSYVLVRFIKPETDTVWCDLALWETIERQEKYVKSKRFRDQTVLILHSGSYTIRFYVKDSLIYEDKLSILENTSCNSVINIPYKDVPLKYFNFAKVLHATTDYHGFIGPRKSSIEF